MFIPAHILEINETEKLYYCLNYLVLINAAKKIVQESLIVTLMSSMLY